MMARLIVLCSSCLAVGLAPPAPARAAISVDVTRATFNNNVAPGSYTETFTGNAGATASSLNFTGGTPTFGYSVTTSDSSVYRSGTFIGSNDPNVSLTFTPTTGNISAFGGDFFITNISNTFQAVAETVTVTDNLGLPPRSPSRPPAPRWGASWGSARPG